MVTSAMIKSSNSTVAAHPTPSTERCRTWSDFDIHDYNGDAFKAALVMKKMAGRGQGEKPPEFSLSN